MNFPIPLPMITPEAAFEAYKPLVEQFDQAVPMLLWASRKGITPVQVLPPDDGVDYSVGDLYEMVIEQAIAALGQPRWVVASGEAFRADVNPEEMDTYEHGDAQQWLATGEHNVTEVVFITGVSTTGEWTYQVPFERTGHRVRWGTPELRNDAEGHIPSVLKAMVR